jgi:hypothetical protein
MRVTTLKILRILVLAALMVGGAVVGHELSRAQMARSDGVEIAQQGVVGALVGATFGFFSFGIIWKPPKQQ